MSQADWPQEHQPAGVCAEPSVQPTDNARGPGNAAASNPWLMLFKPSEDKK